MWLARVSCSGKHHIHAAAGCENPARLFVNESVKPVSQLQAEAEWEGSWRTSWVCPLGDLLTILQQQCPGGKESRLEIGSGFGSSSTSGSACQCTQRHMHCKRESAPSGPA